MNDPDLVAFRDSSRRAKVNPPTRDDGRHWPLAMRFHLDTRIAFAMDAESLVSILMGDARAYSEGDARQRLEDRIRLAMREAMWLQALAVNLAARPLTKQESAVIFRRPDQPAVLEPAGVSEGGVWDGPCRLVLVSTQYAPWSQFETPTGTQVDWIDPITSWTLLRSLSELGRLRLFVRAHDAKSSE